MADIDIGQILEALNNKEDIDQRNVDTASKADAVIDYQEPTSANGYTWFRKYASGWVEQGGIFLLTNVNYQTCSLVVEMANTNYTLVATYYDQQGSDNTVRGINVGAQTTTGFEVKTGVTNKYICYQISGMAA